MRWEIKFIAGWDRHFKKFDNDTRQKIIKKIEKMEQPLAGRGLHSSTCKVEKVGQYRIAYIQDEEARTKNIHFIGNHKQYEKWFKTGA